MVYSIILWVIIMKYIIDNDLHIHSLLSSCSADSEQTTQRILEYAKENSLKTVCLTDHFWDDAINGASDWYAPQNYEHISRSLPLPKDNSIRFLFGCETELNKDFTLGISKEKFNVFDFFIIPTTHFHMRGFTLSEQDSLNAQTRADAWVKRLEAVLGMDLPFKKIGLAHLTCSLIAPTRNEYLEVLSLIHSDKMQKLFKKAAKLGVGIELNASDMNFAESEADIILRPYKIAKEMGCKFYCGSDAHHPITFNNCKKIFERAVDSLNLTEDDKFVI